MLKITTLERRSARCLIPRFDDAILSLEWKEAVGIKAPAFAFSTTHTDRHLTEIADLIAPQGRVALIDTVAELVDAGRIRTMAPETLSPSSAATLTEARRRIESATMHGKIVLEEWEPLYD